MYIHVYVCLHVCMDVYACMTRERHMHVCIEGVHACMSLKTQREDRQEFFAYKEICHAARARSKRRKEAQERNPTGSEYERKSTEEEFAERNGSEMETRGRTFAVFLDLSVAVQ